MPSDLIRGWGTGFPKKNHAQSEAQNARAVRRRGQAHELLIQLWRFAPVWAAGATFVLLKLVEVFVPLRVSREHELEGLDITQNGEALQSTNRSVGIKIPFRCPRYKHEYVGTLSCL